MYINIKFIVYIYIGSKNVCINKELIINATFTILNRTFRYKMCLRLILNMYYNYYYILIHKQYTYYILYSIIILHDGFASNYYKLVIIKQYISK